MNEKMLQRQIMFKQLQELQRRQQQQEISNTRNQNYVNQLQSSKQALGGHFSPSANGTPIQDPPGIFTVGNIGNMQMMQQGGPNGLFLSQSPFGMSHPQPDMSLYGGYNPNLDKNLNQYSHLQGPSNLPASLLTKNNVQPLSFGSSFMSQKFDFPSDQISVPAGSPLSNQEKNFFGQSPVQGSHGGNLSGNYSQQGITMQGNVLRLDSEGRCEDTSRGGLSPGRSSNLGLSVRTEDPDAASLDPLEQKILYNTDDNSWESPFRRISKMGTGGFGGALEHSSIIDPSIQSGSWSALMQSALAETSGNDPGVQEEWSGLSFQNQEPSNDNQQPNFIDSRTPQYNWVNRKSPNAISPSSEPENLPQSFNNYQQSSHQNQQQKDAYHSESSHATMQNPLRSNSLLADYNSQLKQSTGRSLLIQTSLPLPNIWLDQHKKNSNDDTHQPSYPSQINANQLINNLSGAESKGDFWLRGSTSNHGPSGIQKPYDQVNQLNICGYLGEPENMASGENVEARTTPLGASLECPGENVAAQSESMLELLNKDDISNDQAPAMQLSSHSSTPGELPLTVDSAASFAEVWKTSSLRQDFGRLRPADPQTPQSHSFFPSLSMGTSTETFVSCHNVNDHVENQRPVPLVPSQMASQQDISSLKPYKFSSNLFHSPDSASGSLETSISAPNEKLYQNSFHHDNSVQEYSGKSWHEQRLEKVGFLHENSNEINSSTSLSCSIQKQENLRKHQLGADDFGSESLVNNMHQQPTSQAEGTQNGTPSFPVTDIGSFSHSLGQNFSLLHQKHSIKNAGTDDFKRFPPKYDSINYQHPMGNVGKLLLSGQKSDDNDAKDDLNAGSQVGAFWFRGNKESNFSQEGHGEQSTKALLTSQNFQQKGMLFQNGSNEESNLAHQSPISFPMAPSWSKHNCGNMKNGQMLQILDPRAAFSEMALGKLQENNLNMQVNLANGSRGSGLQPSVAATPTACEQLNPPSVLPSVVAYQTLADSLPNKRKLVALDAVPWHKEVNHGQSSLQNIRTTELSWAQASNRREGEIKYEVESFEDLHPVIRAKRRLISTTQLVQQLFQPVPSVILCSDASSNCDHIAYYTARLALGDACSLTSQLPSGSCDVPESPDKLKTSKGANISKFPKLVECFIDRVKKLGGDITRMEKSLLFVDIKVEALELEKFSTINRFAKFHIKAHPSTVDLTSSPTTTIPKPHPQRYVVGHPMPKIVPEGIDCLSL